ncbi:zymogen granule membrane protein 16, partial [Ailuropoda melanoleuca]|uniref:zymogen granule membrane protein 16 n=1 Tax=Ailuropoda melanoleuca TaxID=9646 RepID=UPI00149461F0
PVCGSQWVGQEPLNSDQPTQSPSSFRPRPVPSLQVRYGKVWSDYVGGSQGDLEEIFLHPGESVIQVSGNYKYYLRKLVFVTDKGRYLPFGKDTGTSFNAVPLYPNTVLRFISGRAGALINAIGLHWDAYPSD